MKKGFSGHSPEYLSRAIGSFIIVGMIVALIWVGEFEFLSFATSVVLFSLLGAFLYSVKVKSWIAFFFKLIVNILFHPLYIILLLKSWTMLGYKKQLEEIDRKLGDARN